MLSFTPPHVASSLDHLAAQPAAQSPLEPATDTSPLIAQPMDDPSEAWWARRVERADARAERRGQMLNMLRSDTMAVAQPAMGLLALASY